MHPSRRVASSILSLGTVLGTRSHVMQAMLCTRVSHRPATCCDEFGILFPQRHNEQGLAWIVLLSTTFGKLVDQSEYVFIDGFLTREQYGESFPKKSRLLGTYHDHGARTYIIFRVSKRPSYRICLQTVLRSSCG